MLAEQQEEDEMYFDVNSEVPASLKKSLKGFLSFDSLEDIEEIIIASY